MNTPLHDWVLLVDDDRWALEITKVRLEQNGITAHPCETVDDAIAAVQRFGPPSVLLLDVMMPDANGFEVCRRLRTMEAFKRTRVVFVTSLDDEASQIAALEAGADDLLSKPLREPILVAKIRSLMELARLRDRDHARLEYETVLDTIGEGVITLDHDDHVLTANRPARRLLGLPEEWSGPVHLPTFIDQHWQIEQGTVDRSARARLVSRERMTGVTAAVDWTSRQLPVATDTEAAWTVVLRDATDAWERDHATGRLLRTLSHKIRIPLTGVTASLELLRESATPGSEQHELLDIARDSSLRLSETVMRILEFATARGGSSASTSTLDPGRAGAQLSVHPDTAVKVALMAPVRLDLELAVRGIAELTDNARAAGATSVLLEIGPNPDGSVTFAVSDDGRGLAPGSTQRIFEPFYQTDRSGEQSGAGLGLTILAAEVDSRGGSFGAISPVDGPTTVWFRLPGERTAPAGPRSGKPERRPGEAWDESAEPAIVQGSAAALPA